MKLGICEKDLRGTLEETLNWISENGFSGFQIWKPKLDNEGISPSDFLAMAQDRGLEISAIGGGPNLVDPECAEDTISKFKKFIDLSVDLGPRIVTAESKKKPEGLSIDDAWASTVSTVSAICEYASEKDACLAIEAAGPCFITDHEMFIELKEKVSSSALKVNYDPANIAWADKDPAQGAQAVGSVIIHTHAMYPQVKVWSDTGIILQL
jgi:sugar phosphate isomerase/epimerase